MVSVLDVVNATLLDTSKILRLSGVKHRTAVLIFC